MPIFPNDGRLLMRKVLKNLFTNMYAENKTLNILPQ
jgi:hypothetical protein